MVGVLGVIFVFCTLCTPFTPLVASATVSKGFAPVAPFGNVNVTTTSFILFSGKIEANDNFNVLASETASGSEALFVWSNFDDVTFCIFNTAMSCIDATAGPTVL